MICEIMTNTEAVVVLDSIAVWGEEGRNREDYPRILKYEEWWNVFYVLLTVHACIILQISPNKCIDWLLWGPSADASDSPQPFGLLCKNRCIILFNIFISLLYMFRASMCPSSGENYCIYATLVFSISVGGVWSAGWIKSNPTNRPDATHTEWQMPVSHR